MKIKVLNTLKSAGIIIPAGQILVDDDIPPFILALVEKESEHVEVMQEELFPRELGPDEILKDASEEGEIDGETISAEEVIDSLKEADDSSEEDEKEEPVEEKITRKRK